MNASVDTLAAAKRLRAAGFDEQQAEAIAYLIRDGVAGVDLSKLVTKADLRDELKHLITKADLRPLRAGLFWAMLGQTIIIVGTIAGLLKLLGH